MFEMEDYDSDNNNFIFTPDHLETIIKYEEMVTEDDTWKNYYCYVGDDTTYYQCSYFSLAQRVMQHFESSTNDFTTQDVIDYVWGLYDNNEALSSLIKASFENGYADNNKTKYYRSFLTSGGPVPATITITNGSDGTVIKTSIYKGIDDDYDAQESEYHKDFAVDFWDKITVKHESKLSDGNLRIAVLIFSVWQEYIFVLFFGSIPFVFAAMIVVVVWMTIHLQSIFLSCLGVVGIMLSFPFAYFFYDYVLQNGYFDFISAMIIFVLLGVGADDVFVFTGMYYSCHFKISNLFFFFSVAFRQISTV